VSIATIIFFSHSYQSDVYEVPYLGVLIKVVDLFGHLLKIEKRTDILLEDLSTFMTFSAWTS